MKIEDNLYIIGLLSIYFILYFVSINISNRSKSDKNKLYCGLKSLPTCYKRYGNRYECLQRGYGSGYFKNENGYPFRKYAIIIIIIVMCISIYNYIKNNKK